MYTCIHLYMNVCVCVRKCVGIYIGTALHIAAWESLPAHTRVCEVLLHRGAPIHSLDKVCVCVVGVQVCTYISEYIYVVKYIDT